MNAVQNAANVYARMPHATAAARKILGRGLTYAEKILYTHLFDQPTARGYQRGVDYVGFRPDRVAMQDATAQMALLQFMNAGRQRTSVPTSVHCDHLISAEFGAQVDLANAKQSNAEVYDFLRNAANAYGIDFWEPGAGIIHQVFLENYAFPGGVVIGTDSHTPNAGGLGMLGIGVGGSDAVDAMVGMMWELLMPRLIGVKLTGELNGWTSAKDVILHLAGLLSVKGATNAIIEYFGSGAETLSATGKATICNMGAEVGATASLFGFDEAMANYLVATNRAELAELASSVMGELNADAEVSENPEAFFDQVIEVDLSTLEPYVNGPFTPDAATPISNLAQASRAGGWPLEVESGLIGSCTNSSYQDLSRVASLARQARAAGLTLAAPLLIVPGSQQIRTTAQADGLLEPLNELGAVFMANACGPCIGQWNRTIDDNTRPNTIVTSFNRNFAKRADGNPNTHIFVTSVEMVFALSLAGRLDFNPLVDPLTTPDGKQIRLQAPTGIALPPEQFRSDYSGKVEPTFAVGNINIATDSQRLALLEPFASWDGEAIIDARLLIKTAGKTTTDHISMAGPWLRFRGHLGRISDNLLLGAVNAFNGRTNTVLNRINDAYEPVAKVARDYQSAGFTTVIVAEENYGEGSSREHAAMSPRYLGARVVLVKSFARIHETNLKKQGMLAITFANPADYDRIREDDSFTFPTLGDFAPNTQLRVELKHSDGTSEAFMANHTYSASQIAWFKAGSALNVIAGNAEQP